MPRVAKEWTCKGCGREWVNVITWEKAPEQRGDGNVVCPTCGRGAVILGKPGERIAAVETLPREHDA
jgi:hypothetical protein